MDPIIGASLAQGGSDLLGSVFNYATQKKQLERQRQYDKYMTDYTYGKDLEMWNTMNKYNAPQAQMERLKVAGLNPNLVYGKGAVGNTTAQLPKYNKPSGGFVTAPPVQSPDVLGKYLNVSMNQAQLRNIEAQSNYTTSKTSTEALIQAQKDIDNQIKNYKLQTDKAIYDLQHNTYIGKKGMSEAVSYYRYSIDQQRILNDRKNELAEAQRRLALANTKLATQNTVKSYHDAVRQQTLNKYIFSDKLYQYGMGIIGGLGLSRIGRRFSKGTAPKLKTPQRP